MLECVTPAQARILQILRHPHVGGDLLPGRHREISGGRRGTCGKSLYRYNRAPESTLISRYEHKTQLLAKHRNHRPC